MYLLTVQMRIKLVFNETSVLFNANCKNTVLFRISLGLIHYNVQYGGSLSGGETLNCSVTVLNGENSREKFTWVTDDGEGLSGTVRIENAKLWWPYLMHEVPGYMYTLEVRLRRVPSNLIIA